MKMDEDEKRDEDFYEREKLKRRRKTHSNFYCAFEEK